MFNPNGVPGSVYTMGVGSTPSGNVSNPDAVSLCDVACFQVSH